MDCNTRLNIKNQIEFFIYIIGSIISPLRKMIKKCHKSYLNTYEKKRFAKCGKNLFLKPPFSICGEEYMIIGENFECSPGLRLECIGGILNGVKLNPQLIIGNGVGFGNNCHIGCINHIEIGDNVTLGSNVLIGDHSHGDINDIETPVMKRPLRSKGPIIIEENVWIGENVCILPNVTIGKYSIIGAGAVVTHDIPSYSVAVGVPAKVIKYVKKDKTILRTTSYNNEYSENTIAPPEKGI